MSTSHNVESGAPSTAGPLTAPSTEAITATTTVNTSKRRFRVRANYFCVGDIVWVRPAKLPYWPAEVIECDATANLVRARLIQPPSSAALEANLKEEVRKHQQNLKKEEARLCKQQKREAFKATTESVSAHAAPAAVSGQPKPQSDVVTASGLAVYFFDKLRTPEELETCIEDRLQRSSHNVEAYEAAFTRAVMQANRIVRIPLSPEKLLPYEVCAVGIVHSLMRAQIAAPRQPNTGTFEPQTGLIRLRSGLENAVRDLQGFEFIWVLFQFSFAAPMASGEGQESVRKLRAAKREEEQHRKTTDESTTAPPTHTSSSDSTSEGGNAKTATASAAGMGTDATLSTFRRRQGFDRALGFKTMIIPPRDEELRGVFATRSPHRPNFIGLSCVRLVAVHGLDIHIADHDLLHGTPVLDIKPYLPFCDAHPDARAGWVEKLEASGKSKGDHKYDKQANFVDRVTSAE
jgi:tRNA (Thr-GGU) A37 N-methylase